MSFAYMKTCLILAFENARDLNRELNQFGRIDAYGPLAKTNIKFKNLHIFRQFFWIENYTKPKEKYSQCIIKHPDIWGEPINWIRAISAIAESVRGRLICVFWMPSEIIAFNFFLSEIMGRDIILRKVYMMPAELHKNNNLVVEWEILKTKRKMLSFYRKRKMKIIRRFYRQIGPLYWKMSINKAKRLLKRKYAISTL